MNWWKDKQFKLLAKDLKKAKDREFKARLNLLVSYVGGTSAPVEFVANDEPVDEPNPMAQPRVRKDIAPGRHLPPEPEDPGASALVEYTKEEAEAKAIEIVAEKAPKFQHLPVNTSFSFPMVGGRVRKTLMATCKKYCIAMGVDIQVVDGRQSFVVTKEA